MRLDLPRNPEGPSAASATSPSTADAYRAFLRRKAQLNDDAGFAPRWMPGCLFDFQHALTDWSIRKGRAATFSDCGTGKSLMELVWAENVVRHTNGRVLFLTPIAVGAQMVREGEKFGVGVTRTREGAGLGGAGIYVTNYEQLHHYDPGDFAGVVCDESSILKSFEGVTRTQVTEFLRRLRYRALFTATAAPNDFFELGTSSEALGYLGHTDMLNRFFRNDRGNADTHRAWGVGGGATQWRFKGHAEVPFWRWVCSWARALRRPSDLGFDDGRFVLPRLVEREHIVKASQLREGMLFAMAASGLAERREERRRTLRERCERAAALVADTGRPAVCWANLNDEADLLERLVPGAIQVSGRDDDRAKEEKFEAFTRGEARVLVTKPAIGAWGMNWQHCAHMTTFASDSFEQDYQCIRRFWRFGQSREVVVDRVVSDGEGSVLANLRRKAEQADLMFDALVRHMRDGMEVARDEVFDQPVEVPSWL